MVEKFEVIKKLWVEKVRNDVISRLFVFLNMKHVNDGKTYSSKIIKNDFEKNM